MDFIHEMQNVITGIQTHETANILAAAIVCAKTIKAGRAVLMFGAGHSALPPQEAFPAHRFDRWLRPDHRTGVGLQWFPDRQRRSAPDVLPRTDLRFR